MTYTNAGAGGDGVAHVNLTEINGHAIYDLDPVANETNKGAGVYHYYINMSGYRKLGLQFDLVGWGAGDTIQLYGTMTDNDQDDCTYHDITPTLTDGSSTITASGQILDFDGICSLFKYIRVTVTITGGGSEDYVISCKKVW